MVILDWVGAFKHSFFGSRSFKRNIKILGVGLAFFATAAGAQDLAVTASVDRASVRQNESFTYTLRVEGSFRGEPDDTALRQAFDVLNIGTSTRIQIVNGQTQQVALWQYQLMAPQPGAITIPPVEIGSIAANSVTINVLPEAPPGDTESDIFMEVEALPTQAYEQAQIVFTVRLFVGVPIGRATMTSPEIEGVETIVERLGEDARYRTIRGGREFDVRERRYAVFAQSPGSVTIGPVVFEAMVVPPRGFSRVQRFRSNTASVEVLPAVAPPPEYPNAVWLPASRIEISDRWSKSTDALEMGVPLTRTLTIAADGLLETQLPELFLDQADGIRQYPDQPELERSATESGMTVARTERYAVIAQRAGVVALPAIELPWWNVATKAWEVARIDAREVTVTAAAGAGDDLVDLAPDVIAEPEIQTVPVAGIWPYTTAIASIGWAITALLWWLKSRGGSIGFANTAFARVSSERRRLRAAVAACTASDSHKARQELLDWAAVRFQDSPPRTLGALARALPSEVANSITELESFLYANRGGAWDGQPLATLLGSLERANKGSASQKKHMLPPLYR